MMQALPNLDCPLCGGPNRCVPAGTASLDRECWCTAARVSPAALAQIPEHLRRKACLCPACASGATLARPKPEAP